MRINNNNIEYTSLCGAGRIGYDFDINASKDENAFNKAIESFKQAKAIRFSSMVTNEEAYLLQLLKEKLGIKLFNEDARKFQEFMKAYSSISGKLHHSGSIDAIKQADAVIVIGSKIASDNPAVSNALITSSKDNGAKIVYAHPMEDPSIQNIVTQFMKYEVGTEEGVLALLANGILENADLSDDERAFFNDLDLGYLGAESNIGNEEIDHMMESFSQAKNCVLVVGNDLMAHSRSQNIAKLAAMIEKYSSFSLVIVPAEVNTLGVSLICDLDKDEDIENVVGYNAKGNYTISSLSYSNLDVPSLNKHLDTFVNIDNNVVVINVTAEFDSYSLNDIASALDVKTTQANSLEKSLSPYSSDKKACLLDEVACKADGKLEAIDELPEFNGTIIYQVNPAEQLEKDNTLRGSAQFASAARISDGDKVEINFGSQTITRDFKLDSEMKGTIALNPIFDNVLDASRYKFEKSKIKRVIQ